MKTLSACLVALSLVAVALPAWAQDEPEVIFSKHTVVNLEGDLIDGNLAHPDQIAIEARKRDRYRSLIETRTSFHSEILYWVPKR